MLTLLYLAFIFWLRSDQDIPTSCLRLQTGERSLPVWPAQDLGVGQKDLSDSLLASPPRSSRGFLLAAGVRSRPVEISTFCWRQKFLQRQVEERESLGLFESMVNPVILCEAVEQSGHDVQRLFHSALTFQGLVGSPRCVRRLAELLPSQPASSWLWSETFLKQLTASWLG